MTKNIYPPLPTSDKLTALLDNKDRLTANIEQCRREVTRMNRIINPNFDEVTVRHIDDIGVERRQRAGVVHSGGDERGEEIRKQDAINRALAGEPLADTNDIKQKLAQEHRQWSVLEDALEFCNRELEAERLRLAKLYCKQLKPKNDELLRRTCQAVLELHAASFDLNGLKRHLIDNGIGLHGLFNLSPDFLGSPNDKHSDMALFIREAHQASYISAIPAELKL